MSTHDPNPPDEGTVRWTAPTGQAISPLPQVEPSAAYDTPPTAPRATRRLLLPLIGLLVLVVVVVAAAYVVLSMQRGAGAADTRPGYEYLSDQSMLALELRLDLPGDQREQLVRFLTRFPQFSDAAQVESSFEQMLNEAIATASSGMANYDDDVRPWFSGWMVAGVEVPPDTEAAAMGPGSFVAVLGSTSREAAERGLERVRGADSWTSEAGPGGSIIWSGTPRFDGTTPAYALTDDAVVVSGSLEDLRTALERKTSDATDLLGVQSFSDALTRQPDGRLGMFWVDYEGFTQAMRDADGPGASDNPFEFSCPGVVQPRAMSGSMYMRDGAAHIDAAIEYVPGGPTPQMRDSGLAGRMPNGAVLFVDVHDVGAGVTSSLACLRQQPMFREPLIELEEQIGQPIDQLVGWAGDTAFGVRYDGSTITGGLIIHSTDQLRAADAMGQLRALIAAGAGQEGGVIVREEDYNGARMVTFELRDGLSMDPPAPQASMAYAFVDDLVVIGVDTSFVRAVIDTQPADSLASSPEYRRAVEAAGGASNGGVMYVDLGTSAMLADMLLASGPMDGGMMDDPAREMRAVLGALESLVLVSRVEGDVALTRMVLSAREP